MGFRKVAILLVILSAVFCAPLLQNLDNWGRQDWDQFIYRYETARVALLQYHQLPFWNPYSNGGTALLAHPDSPVLSPWYIIVLLFGSPLGLRIQVLIFTALGAVGMAALSTRMGATRAGSIAGGIVFMMSSHFALHMAEGHLEWCVLALMPWLALCVLRLHEGMRFVLLAALILASVLTFGAVYIPAVFLPFFSVWVFLNSIRDRQVQPLLRWGAVVIVAALLSAVKLVPMVAFTSDSPREVPTTQQTPLAVMVAGLFDPQQAVLYQAFRDRMLPDDYFAKKIPAAEAAPVLQRLKAMNATEGFHEYGCYIGFAGLILAALGAWHTGRRLWPIYATGALAGVVALGASAPVDLWLAMRHLPLYGQLQVPSRFTAAMVFVLALAAALGLSSLSASISATRFKWHRPIEVVMLVLLFGELAALSRNLFTDVFVLPPIALETHRDFAQRFTKRTLYPIVTQSSMYAYLQSNSGTLDAYENLSVKQGKVLTSDNPFYRGEAYLAQGHGSASISEWTMSSVTVRLRLDRPDTLVLNQNFYHGWMFRRPNANGHITVSAANDNGAGLIAVPVDRGETEVTSFYVPRGFALGKWISAVALVLCLAGLWFTRKREPAVLARP